MAHADTAWLNVCAPTESMFEIKTNRIKNALIIAQTLAAFVILAMTIAMLVNEVSLRASMCPPRHAILSVAMIAAFCLVMSVLLISLAASRRNATTNLKPLGWICRVAGVALVVVELALVLHANSATSWLLPDYCGTIHRFVFRGAIINTASAAAICVVDLVWYTRGQRIWDWGT